MNIDKKLERLDEIYKLHDSFFASLDVECGKKCDACCTCNVTMTTLEGRKIIRHLSLKKINFDDIKARFAQGEKNKRFIPALTVNRVAEYCRDDRDLPEEENDPAWGKCPFLQDGLCEIYEARPLMCRSLVSKKRCSDLGYADMSPLILNVNNLFSQFIEHLDDEGLTGNLTDVILNLILSLKEGNEPAKAPEDKGRLLHNISIPVLMIPPEDFETIKPILKSLSEIVPREKK